LVLAGSHKSPMTAKVTANPRVTSSQELPVGRHADALALTSRPLRAPPCRCPWALVSRYPIRVGW
jgi:hypothetical protein